jgi:hypothetical protein
LPNGSAYRMRARKISARCSEGGVSNDWFSHATGPCMCRNYSRQRFLDSVKNNRVKSTTKSPEISFRGVPWIR